MNESILDELGHGFGASILLFIIIIRFSHSDLFRFGLALTRACDCSRLRPSALAQSFNRASVERIVRGWLQRGSVRLAAGCAPRPFILDRTFSPRAAESHHFIGKTHREDPPKKKIS